MSLGCKIGSSWKPSGLRGGIAKAILPFSEITKQYQRAIKPHWRQLFRDWARRAAGNETTPIGQIQEPVLTNSNPARILAPFVCSRSAESPTATGHAPAGGYHLPGCTWGNGPAGPRKVARRTRNIKHDKRGERQMPDPGRQHRGREAFQPKLNNSSY